MRAAQLTAIRRIEIGEIPRPSDPGENDVLVRVRAVGVCGSDIHYFRSGRIGSQIVEYPFVIGHEASGIVEGRGGKVARVKPGDRVALDPSVSCGHCDQCMAGREHTCRNLLFLGCPGQLTGSLCELVALPEKCCYPIPEEMTFEQAVLTEPLAIALYTIDRSGVLPTANIAILGTGPIGMSVFHILRARRAGRIYVTDKIAARLSLAARLRPVWSGNPDAVDIVQEIAAREPLLLDCVYECSGDAGAISQAVRLLKPGGLLVLVGIPETDGITLPIHELRRKEITIINIRRQVHCTQKAIDLIASHGVDLDSMVTHRFSLGEAQAALELVEAYRDGVMKAVISTD